MFVQALLFTCTCSALVCKKALERSDRTWVEFGLDTSKQILGGGWMHVANMLCAIIFSSTLPGVDECTWYAAQILVDTTLGVFVEWCLLRGLDVVLKGLRMQGAAQLLDSGSYRDASGGFRPASYVGQLTVWLAIVTLMKMSMVELIWAVPIALYALDVALHALEPLPRLKLFVVMVCLPVVMNVLQMVLTDNFIKRRNSKVIRHVSGPDACDCVPGGAGRERAPTEDYQFMEATSTDGPGNDDKKHWNSLRR